MRNSDLESAAAIGFCGSGGLGGGGDRRARSTAPVVVTQSAEAM